MIVNIWTRIRKEVISIDPFVRGKKPALRSGRHETVCGEEIVSIPSNHHQNLQEAENGKTNDKLTSRSGANPFDHHLFEQIILSPRKTNSTRLASPLEGNVPLSLFGMYLGSLRRRKGLTVEDLAKASRISIDLAARIELGVASLSEYAENLAGVSEALGEDVHALTKLILEIILE